MDEAPHEEQTHPGSELPGAREAAVAALLLDLGQALHASAMPSNLTEERLRAVARGLGTRAEVFVSQGFLVIESGPGASQRVDLRRISFDTHWNLGRVHALVDLCTRLARGEGGLAAARAELERILAQPRPYARWLVVLGYGVYSGAVAARVGGGALEAAVGAVIGLLAGGIHFETIRYQRVDLQKSFLAALIGCLAAFVLTLVLPPFDPARALFGGITLLVPAMVLTIGTHELANDALESGVARLAYGLLRFVMLGLGIAVALQLLALLGPLPAPVKATPLPWPIVLTMVALGGAALTVCLQGHRRDLPWIAAAAVLAFGIQELTKVMFGGRGSPLVAALALGIVANLYGRTPGHIPATVLVPGLLQLAPGFLGTQAVIGLIGRGGRAAAEPAGFFDVFIILLQLVLGLVLADVLVGRQSRRHIVGREPAAAA